MTPQSKEFRSDDRCSEIGKWRLSLRKWTFSNCFTNVEMCKEEPLAWKLFYLDWLELQMTINADDLTASYHVNRPGEISSAAELARGQLWRTLTKGILEGEVDYKEN
ncbi:hypothetical protein CEXT_316211 [Caerostris extrusa]|uniref:Uncharacterized protein n=1 Tax=Caerostris extrusa TaxID=172846 RepID=A0AAV4X9G9_CAEEX|nr:hypothetical protein CEXT_316211 [Caerostris extrusa]